jgi:hypothetical protein
MDSKERTSSRHLHVEDILGHLNNNVDRNNAEKLLHCILTSTIFSHGIFKEKLYKVGIIYVKQILYIFYNILFYHIILKFQSTEYIS